MIARYDLLSAHAHFRVLGPLVDALLVHGELDGIGLGARTQVVHAYAGEATGEQKKRQFTREEG